MNEEKTKDRYHNNKTVDMGKKRETRGLARMLMNAHTSRVVAPSAMYIHICRTFPAELPRSSRTLELVSGSCSGLLNQKLYLSIRDVFLGKEDSKIHAG